MPEIGSPEGQQALRDAEQKVKQIEADSRRDKMEVKDELWALIAEYLKMLRSWPNEQPIQEPFILQWHPPVGQTQYGRDVESAMRWIDQLQKWRTKAEARLNGIAELDLIQNFSNRRVIHQSPLGALPFLLQTLAHVEAEVL